MNRYETKLVHEALKNITKDPIYAQELITEVLAISPKVLTQTRWFHGDKSKRSDFSNQKMDRDRKTSDGNALGPGIYFTNIKRIADEYGPYLYEGEPKSGFNLLPTEKAELWFTQALYEEAPEEKKERFMLDWEGLSLKEVLQKYTRTNDYSDAALGLYGDLFNFNSEEYVKALVSIGYDGSLHKMDNTRESDDVYYLIVWNPKKFAIKESDYRDGEIDTDNLKENKDKPSYRDLKDAVDHFNSFDGTSYDIKDFNLKYLGNLDVDDLYEYDDIDAWLDIEQGELEGLNEDELRQELDYFRTGYGNLAMDWLEEGKIPPIIVIGDEEPSIIGDGRGRVNLANGLDITLPVWEMLLKK